MVVVVVVWGGKGEAGGGGGLGMEDTRCLRVGWGGDVCT